MASLVRSTGTVAISTLTSRIMGFVREMLFANFFGASGSTDAFFVAFRIPNLLRRLVAEGALTISFIPVYTEYKINMGRAEAMELAQKTLSILMLVITFLVVMGEIFSPEIVSLFACGFEDPAKIDLAVRLNRVLFPYLFFVGFVAYAMGILNSHGYFFSPAFAPVLLNAGMITGIVLLSRFFSEPLFGVCAGVIAGGVLQVLLQVPYLVKSGFRMKVSLDFKHPGIRRIFRMIAPAVFGIAVYQINILMSTILASLLPFGSISYLYYSDRLTEMVLGVFIVSIGNVILPEMSRMTATDDFDSLKGLYIRAVRASLFLAVPASVALMTVGLPIISVIFQHGEFTSFDAAMTARALFYASIGIASVSVLRITTPTFYSMKDTKTPVIAATAAFVINIGLGYILMQTGLRHAGLSLANSISVTVQMLILLFWLKKRIGSLDLAPLLSSLVRVIISSAIMAMAIMYIAGMVNWDSDPIMKKILYLFAIVISGGTVYAISCALLRVDEMNFILKRIRRRQE